MIKSTRQTQLVITDPTLRDGSHACNHLISEYQLIEYLKIADQARYDFIEIGHGNGLGASSLQLGESMMSEVAMLQVAKATLKRTKLSVHSMPGFSTIQKNIAPAVECGVDLFRIGTHCTEADLSSRHIEFVRKQGREAWGILMMTHMATKEVLLQESKKMASYGAQGIVLMDSAGFYVPSDVTEKVGHLVEHLDVPVGFHAHNNLGLSVANSIAAVEVGGEILDGTARGFGAGAGNAPIELIVAALHRNGYSSRLKVDLNKVLECSDRAGHLFKDHLPANTSITIMSGMNGVFSGFAKPAIRIAKELDVDVNEIFIELGRRKIVGGQEDIIMEVACELKKKALLSGGSSES